MYRNMYIYIYVQKYVYDYTEICVFMFRNMHYVQKYSCTKLTEHERTCINPVGYNHRLNLQLVHNSTPNIT